MALLLCAGAVWGQPSSGIPPRPQRVLFANLGTPQDSNWRYCTDCAASSPCTGSGSGAFAFRVGSAWNCNVGAPALATPVSVANGGTGLASATAFAPLFGGTTSTGAFQSGSLGTSGWVLTSNGAGALPTFQAAAGGSFVALDGSTIGATGNVQKFTAGVQVGDTSTTAGTVDFANGSTVTALRLRWDDVTHTAGTGRPIKIVLNGNIGIGGLTWTWRATSGTTAYLGDALSAFASTTSAGLASVISDEQGSGPLLFGTAPTISSPTINTGITSGTGFQHIRVASCTTGTLVNAACDTTITWPVAFADTNYTAGAILSDPSGGLVFILSEKSKTTTTMVVTLVTLTAAASSGTVNAWAFHD